MKFDKLCIAIEKYLPKLLPILNEAKLFEFPYRAHEIMREFSKEQSNFLCDQFFLPFPCVAVEDTASVVMVWDENPGQVGLDNVRYFVDVVDYSDPTVFREFQNADVDEEMINYLNSYPHKLFQLSFGRVDSMTYDPATNKIGVDGVIFTQFLASKEGIEITDTQIEARLGDSLDSMRASALRSVKTCIEELVYINSPDRFILESSPLKIEKLKARSERTGRPLRSHEREKYVLLKPKEIRTRLGLTQPTTQGGKMPHERRQHFRTLRSDKYVHKKGQTIIIPATWVGPSEVTKGNRRYRVILDK